MTDAHEPKRRGRPPKAKEAQDAETQTATEPTIEALEAEDAGEASGDLHAEAPEAGESLAGESDAPSGDGGVENIAEESAVPLDLAEGWSPMDTAPDGGKPCYVAGLVGPGVPLVVGAYLHHSRRYMGSQFRYVPYTEWRMIDTPFRVPFDPMCWSRYQ